MSFNTEKGDDIPCCDHDSADLSEKNVGHPVPASFVNGPREPKKCTDLLCCIIFLACIVGMVVAIFFHLGSSKVGYMTSPVDSEGNICGRDEKVKDFPYLFMVKFTSKYRSVCVKECPKFDYNQMRKNSTGAQTTGTIEPVYFEGFNAAVEKANTTWDKKTNSTEIKSADDPALFGYDAPSAKGFYTKGQWDNYVARFKLHCKMNSDVSTCAHNPKEKIFMYDSRPVAMNICFPLAPRILKYANFKSDLGNSSMNDLKEAWWVILLSILLCVIIGCLFLVVATYFLPCLLWTQIVLTLLFLLILSIASIVLAIYVNNPAVLEALEAADKFSPETTARIMAVKKRIWLLWVIGVVAFLLFILMTWLICSRRKGISVSLGVLKFASQFIIKHVLVIVVALICFALQVITFLFTVWGLLVLHTSGDIQKSETGRPIIDFHYTVSKWFLMVLAFVVVYWTVIFWNNLSDMVCGGAACNWYFSKDTGVFKTLFQTVFYHSGTVAFASLILLPVTIVQLLFQWIYDLVTDDEENALQKCFGKICCCLIIPYQKIFNRTTEAGLTVSYFASCNFCPSSKRYHYLNLRVGESVGVVSFIGFLFKITGVITIAFLNYWFWSWILNTCEFFKSRISNPLTPLIAIFIASFIVAGLLISVYSTACDALLFCYMLELDLNKPPRHKELADILSKVEPKKTKKDGYKPLN